MLGGLWSRLLFPFGNWAWRVNLLSALFGAVAVGLVCSLAQRLVAGSMKEPASRWTAIATSPIWAGATAAMLFGLGPVWRQQTTAAEVYALHNLFVAAILLAAISLPEGDDRAAMSRFARRMTLLFLLLGIALTHHRTTMLLIPGLAVYFAWDADRLWRLRHRWLLWLAALLAALLVYLYLPLRAAAGVRDLNASYVNTWGGFWDHVLARRYGAFFTDNPLAATWSWRQGWALNVRQIGWMGVTLTAIGVVTGLFTPGPVRRRWLLIVVVAAANLLFSYFYRVGDVEVFLLPVWLCTALFAGGGVAALGGWLGSRPVAAITVQALIVAALALTPQGREAAVDRSQEWAAHDLAVAMTAVDFPPNSQVIGLEGEMTAVRYMQEALGRGVGVETITANDEAQRRTLIAQASSVGRPIYLTRELPGIEDQYSFGGEGALVRVWPRGKAQSPTPQNLLTETLADGALHLIGYDLRRLPATGAPTAELALYWQPQQPLTQTFKASLRVVDDAGATLTTSSGEALVQDLFPLRMVARTPSWLPGEVVRDVYHVPLPAHQPNARLLVILYDAETLAEVGRWQTPLNE